MSGALILGFVTASLAAAPPSIAVPDKYPTQGKAIILTLSASAAKADALRFIYQPDSRVVKIQQLSLTGKTQVSWTPAHAGIVTIQAIRILGDNKTTVLAKRDVSVKFPGTPTGGLLIFLFAGVVLFGGIWLSMRLIFSSPD